MGNIRIHANRICFMEEVSRLEPSRLVRDTLLKAETVLMSVSFAGFLLLFNTMTGHLLFGLHIRGFWAVFVLDISLASLAIGSLFIMFRESLEDAVYRGLMKKMEENDDPANSTFATSILLCQKRTDAIRIPGCVKFLYTDNTLSESDERAALLVINDRAIREIDFDNKEEFIAFEEARRKGTDILLTADTYQ